jgi:hypothetical protein
VLNLIAATKIGPSAPLGKGWGYRVSEVSERGSCEEEVKWPVATGEKSDDTAAHTARILSSRGSSLPEKETTHTI